MTMVRPFQPLSDSDLRVLKTLWELKESTVRQLQEHLTGTEWAYTTVQTLLYRLQEKGYVESWKQGRALVFRPLVSREELLDQQLDVLADQVCDGAVTPLVLNLVENRAFSSEDLEHFQQVLERLVQEKKREEG